MKFPILEVLIDKCKSYKISQVTWVYVCMYAPICAYIRFYAFELRKAVQMQMWLKCFRKDLVNHFGDSFGGSFVGPVRAQRRKRANTLCVSLISVDYVCVSEPPTRRTTSCWPTCQATASRQRVELQAGHYFVNKKQQ